MRRQGTSVMLLSLYAMLIGALLVLVVAGARFYASAVTGQASRSEQRRAASFIQSQIAASGSVSLRQGPEGTMLSLGEPDTEYETRIYLYRNSLRSEFAKVGTEPDPYLSEEICPLTDFSVEREGKLLRITADGRVVTAAIMGGDAP